MSKKTEKRVVWPQKKMGKHCGYHEYEDGRIQVAPCYADEMDELRDQEAAANSMIEAVVKATQPILNAIAKRRRKAFDRMGDDYGFDATDRVYTYHDKTLSHAKKDDK